MVVYHTAVARSTQIVERPVGKLAENFHKNAAVHCSRT